ncbi:MAG: TatD family hydrolase [Candidatus Diapherotrites archaeon]
MLADIHCHLDEFESAKLDQELKKAFEEGISLVVTNSVNPKSMQKNLAISEKYPFVRCALGIHPNEITVENFSLLLKSTSFIEKNISNDCCVAIGETGLDYMFADPNQKELQLRLFEKHIELSKRFKKPIIVHSRGARKECIETLAKNEAEKVVLHWFISDEKLLEKAISLGYFVSIGPSILFQEHVINFAKKIPLENVLFETDAPVTYNGQAAVPCWVKKVAEKFCELKDISFNDMENIAALNLKTLFDK